MSIWKQVTSGLSGIVKQAAKQVAQEPLEVGRSAVQQVSGADGGQALKDLEQGQAQAQMQGTADPNNGGFATKADYERYLALSGRKDELELAAIRRQLEEQWGLDTSIEGGMQKARMEREQKEQQEEQVEERKKQEENWIKEKKKEENYAVLAAKAQASGENKAWGAG